MSILSSGVANGDASSSFRIAIIGTAFRHADDATSPFKEKSLRDCVEGESFLQDAAANASFFLSSSDGKSVVDRETNTSLEVVHEGIENAGLPMERLNGSNTSVYWTIAKGNSSKVQNGSAISASLGAPPGMIHNHISRFYQLRGSSEAIGSDAYSPGLTALNKACQSLQIGDSDISIVGVSGMADDGANGTNGSSDTTQEPLEGQNQSCNDAVLILKRLDAVLQDRDHIHAIVRRVDLFEIGPVDISVWETTASEDLSTSQPSAIGCYYHEGLTPIINAARIMSNTPPISGQYQHQQTKPTQWPQNKQLRASVAGLGRNRSSAQVVLDSLPNPASYPSTLDMSGVYLLSAKDSHASRAMATRLASYIRQAGQYGNGVPMKNIAYTLATRRTRHPWVAAVRARTADELTDRLDERAIKVAQNLNRPRLGFVFNGQGAQWHAMGRELIDAYPVFASAIDRADKVLAEYGAPWSLREELALDKTSTRLYETDVSQSATVALQLCLVDLLKAWDITPSAVSGHSTGEISSAYCAGVLSFEEALGVVYFGGELAIKHKLPSLEGGMLAAGVGPEKAAQYTADIAGHAVIACVNSPENVTFSGDRQALDGIMSRLGQDGAFARHLRVPVAYHSQHMLRIASDYIEKLRSILTSKPKWDRSIVYASPVTGAIVESADIFAADYWVRNITEPVLFSQSFGSVSPHVDFVLEIGPHSTLAGPIRQILGGQKMPYGSCLIRDADAVDTMHDLACELLRHGYPVDLQAVNNPFGSVSLGHVHDLPTYPWNSSGSTSEILQGACDLMQNLPLQYYWELDMTAQVPAAVKDALRIHLDDEDADFERLLRRVSYNFIQDAVVDLENVATEDWPGHYKLLFDCMRQVVALAKSGAVGSAPWLETSKGMKKLLADDVGATNAAGRLLTQLGRNLSNILREGAAPPLPGGEHLDSYYLSLPAFKSRALRQVLSLMNMYAIKNPGARILEIGPGMAAQSILDSIDTEEQILGPLLCHYTVASDSLSSLEEAKRRLADWDSIKALDFQLFDIEGAQAQRLPVAHSYDLVVAPMVLRTENLGRALSHVRKLLSPGGKLLLVDAMQDQKHTHMIFGNLGPQGKPWLFGQPARSVQDWDSILRQSGFNGVELDVNDCEETEYRSMKTILASVASAPHYPYQISIIHNQAPQSWLEQCSAAVRSLSGTDPAVETLDQAKAKDNLCILMTGVDGTDAEVEPSTLLVLRDIITRNVGVLWVTAGPNGMDSPASRQIRDLHRDLRQGGRGGRVGYLDLGRMQAANPWTTETIAQIDHVCRQLFDCNLDYAKMDWEYAVKESILYVPRVYAKQADDSGNKTNFGETSALPPFRQRGPVASWDDQVVDRDIRLSTLRLAALRLAIQHNVAARGRGTAKADPTKMLEQALQGKGTLSESEARRLVANAVATWLANSMDMQDGKIDLDSPVSAHGVDSLIAVELRNWLAGTARAKVSISDIVRCASLLELGTKVMERSSLEMAA
ncbi:hypothetical protein GGR52DRAFT_193072 [Hypoxylon sp. FL1284]|nr:hypothetical protein GGR52DRAFT_193072 [Hypoxylon sp. FL1284]